MNWGHFFKIAAQVTIGTMIALVLAVVVVGVGTAIADHIIKNR